jgi:hypothetical protein
LEKRFGTFEGQFELSRREGLEVLGKVERVGRTGRKELKNKSRQESTGRVK